MIDVDGDSWYDWMKEKWEDLTVRPSEKGESFDRCVVQVMEDGHDEEAAHAICTESVKYELKSAQRKSLLEATKAATGPEGDVGANFGEVIDLLDLEPVSKQTVPEHAVSIDSRSEAPEDAEVIEGPRGGLYYIPATAEDTGEGDVPPVGELSEGQEVTVELRDGEEIPGTVVHVIDTEDEQAAFVQGPGGDPLEVRDDGEGEAELIGVDDEGEEEGSEDIREAFNSETAPEHLDISRAESLTSLRDQGIQGGHDESAMRVGTMPDGSRVFARVGEETGTDVRRTAEVGTIYNALTDNAADAHYDPDSETTVTEGLEGRLGGEVTQEDVDMDSFYETMAASMLAGNYDIHTSNLMVGEEGEVQAFDYDYGGFPMFGDEPIEMEGADDPDVAAEMEPDTVRQAFLGSVQLSAEKMDFEETSTEALREGITEAADRLLSDTEELDGVLDELETDGLAEAVRRNIDAVQEGPEW